MAIFVKLELYTPLRIEKNPLRNSFTETEYFLIQAFSHLY